MKGTPSTLKTLALYRKLRFRAFIYLILLICSYGMLFIWGNKMSPIFFSCVFITIPIFIIGFSMNFGNSQRLAEGKEIKDIHKMKEWVSEKIMEAK